MAQRYWDIANAIELIEKFFQLKVLFIYAGIICHGGFQKVFTCNVAGAVAGLSEVEMLFENE